jgi:hypothetical protein
MPIDRPFWNFVADFGDIGVLLPAALAMAAGLLMLGRSRAALAWVGTFTLCCAATAGLKYLFAGFPSGHASLSTLVYGGLGWAAWSSRHPFGRLLALAAAPIVGVIVAAVMLLRWHEAGGVAVGLLLGIGALLLFARGLSPGRRDLGDAIVLVALAGAVVAGLHGTRVYYQMAPLTVAVVQI